MMSLHKSLVSLANVEVVFILFVIHNISTVAFYKARTLHLLLNRQIQLTYIKKESKLFVYSDSYTCSVS